MRRADRLFQIVQRLHTERPVTAQALAEALSVSVRTIYRDIQDLSLSEVPIEGEPGVGYRLGKGFRLPALMFEREELAALLLGARMVGAWSDRALGAAAARALAKIEAVVPPTLRRELERGEILIHPELIDESLRDRLARLRSAIGEQRKVRFGYVREDGAASTRSVWPLGLFHWGRVWTLVGWCELRDDFRHFRLDRMETVETVAQRYAEQSGRTLADYLRRVRAESGY